MRNGHGVLGKRGRDDSSRLLFGALYCKTWNRQETFGVRRVGEDWQHWTVHIECQSSPIRVSILEKHNRCKWDVCNGRKTAA